MDKKTVLIQAIVFIVFVVICVGGGSVVGIINAAGFGEDSKWYQSLIKPSWNPPSWLFGPVWAVLYTLMGIAAWLVWRQTGFCKRPIPLAVFWIHMVFNFAWVFIFGMAHELGWALVDIVVLVFLIIATIKLFWRENWVAGALLIPYLCWCSFATALNFYIWWYTPSSSSFSQHDTGLEKNEL